METQPPFADERDVVVVVLGIGKLLEDSEEERVG